MAADFPSFSVSADYDIGQVTVGLTKDEWEHMEDHDEALVQLEPLLLPLIHRPMLERTLDHLRAGISAQLHHWVQSGTIYYALHSKWVWDEFEQERRRERRARP